MSVASVASRPLVPRRDPAPSPTPAPAGPQPGADTIGDPYYPKLGNGGYMADHYDVAVAADMDKQTLQGTTTMSAHATQDLSAFNLDFHGFDIAKIQVNGKDATFARQDDELTITPADAIHNGDPFQVTVTYGGTPQPQPSAAIPEDVGWKFYSGGAAVVCEPGNGAHNWFPVNDHPRNKASYSFHVTVPNGWTVAANGLAQPGSGPGVPGRFATSGPEAGPRSHPGAPGRSVASGRDGGNGTTTYNWEEKSPMASYLATIQIGHFVEDDSVGPNGLPIRNFFPTEMAANAKNDFARTGEMIDTFSKLFGPYPFEAYGNTVVSEGLVGGALECQTNSIFDPFVVTGDRSMENVISHELTHQWFGDNVSVKNWKDIFLCEGFASYGEWLWLEHTDGKDAVAAKAQQVYDWMKASESGPHSTERPPAVEELERSMRHSTKPRIEARGSIKIGEPPPDDLFDEQVYMRGALTLYALRGTIGDQAFFSGLQAYQKQFAGGNAEIQDFINVMQDASKQDLKAFFDGWLYQTDLPALPGSR